MPISSAIRAVDPDSIIDGARAALVANTTIANTLAVSTNPQRIANELVAEVTAGEGLPDARAVYMEYGTARIAPRAYMRPAMERYADAFIAEVQAVLNGA